MRNLVLGLSLLLGACGNGGKFADIAGKLGFGGDKNCAGAVSAETAAPPKPVADEETKPSIAQPASSEVQAVAKAPDVLPPPTSAEGRRLSRMAAKAELASKAAAEAEPAAAPKGDVELPDVAEPAPKQMAVNDDRAAAAPRHPSRHHPGAAAVAEPVAVSRRAPVREIDNHDHFSDSTAPSDYRLPVSAQVLVPREGQTVLNGPRHEGVAPPNSDPVRISQN